LVALGGNAGSQPELVSFSSLSIKPLTKGLYIDDGVMVYDPIEDGERVWYPIKRQLWPDAYSFTGRYPPRGIPFVVDRYVKAGGLIADALED
jgi:hypothetical protein